jgi:hypothetical protein
MCRRLIHPSAWKGYSPNFAQTAFYEVLGQPQQDPSTRKPMYTLWSEWLMTLIHVLL